MMLLCEHPAVGPARNNSSTTNQSSSLPGATISYDADGNLTSDGAHTYAWDADGNSTTVDSTTITYDALDRAVEQTTGSTHTQVVYGLDGSKFALMNGTTLSKAFVALPAGAVAVYNSAGLDYYRHADWLGSSRLASTTSQTVYSDVSYAPYGEPYNQYPPNVSDLSFTGQNQDTASGLYDFLYREQSSVQGRWISPDPAGLAAVNPANPQSWNRYAYVNNMPMSFVDPLGLYETVPTDCVTIYPSSGKGQWGAGLQAGVQICPEAIPGIDLSLLLPSLPPIRFGGGGRGGRQAPSNAGLRFVANCEGFSPTAYPDSRGNCTIGYGHLLHYGPCTAADNAMSVTGPAALAQFAIDSNSAATALNNALSVPLTQSQYDAMFSLTFNMGMGRLQTHDVWRDLSAGNTVAVPGDIRSLSAGGPGMPFRRANEANMFSNGVYASACYAHQ